MQRLIAIVAVALAGAIAGPLTRAAGAEPRPLGLTCAPLDGARFCPGNGTTERVPSWDGIPLDADVTLPPTGDGPWPCSRGFVRINDVRYEARDTQHLLGLPTIRATVATSAPYGQLAGRLWDVAPSGTQRLVTRGVYRLLRVRERTRSGRTRLVTRSRVVRVCGA